MSDNSVTEPPEVSDETIYQHLRDYQEAGMIEYVLPTEPLGEQWIIGHAGHILKFTGTDEITAFLAGISVCASYAGKLKASETAPIWDHPSWGATWRQSDAETPAIIKGKTVRIIPERGPERVMVVNHVERHVITLADPEETIPGGPLTSSLSSASTMPPTGRTSWRTAPPPPAGRQETSPSLTL